MERHGGEGVARGPPADVWGRVNLQDLSEKRWRKVRLMLVGILPDGDLLRLSAHSISYIAHGGLEVLDGLQTLRSYKALGAIL